MSWGTNRLTLRHAIAFALLATASAAAADILVVRSVGPSAKSFPPGKRLDEKARITLQASDQLVVLDGRGTRTLRGPGTFTAGTSAPGQLASAAPVQQRRARIGAVRGVSSGELRPPSIWHVDVAKSATVCVAEPAKLTLWRADTARPLTLSIAPQTGAPRRLSFEAGASTAAWPAELPVADGARYRLAGGSGTPTMLMLRTLPQKPAGLEDMAQSLIRNACNAQLDMLIETVRLPEDSAPRG
jgi:hypothetical protein